ncbi:nucleotidyltransferase family protein [Sinorhizobium numidicum]|uniref:Nucleotidyltransferase family protein n=1 Tax=Sinorhizobium numidicum TaxID=680248 RepID=A0ABY8D175_9HYPH|nr:nucleotidyltransferase family protein [Sinorhizobium numidicum]WEX77989.1 nucleotidyltransferase family protein [Sinorhizobium numidicum]WEX84648.1 nucleotidyltransferase family protein [Sinorhizobium numidicum]
MTGNSYRNLLALASCLDGKPPKEINWDELIALANNSLTISFLALATAKFPETVGVPEDVRKYLAVLYERNTQRNLRLKTQLKEAVNCLNRVDIEPIVIKGTAILLARAPSEIGARILTDLDILVRPADMPGAITALQSIGYEIQFTAGDGSWPGNPKFHLPAVLVRPTDVGSIDLQCRPKGPISFSDIERLYRHSSRTAVDGGVVHIPSALAQIVFLILHDQFQDGDYWRGLVDLRHLFDIANIVRSNDVRWETLRSLFADGYERNAADTQILTAATLFRIDNATKLTFGKLPHLQLARRKMQIERQYLAVPLTLLTLLTEVAHYSSWDRYGGEPYPSRWQEAKRKARELRRIFRPKPLGKV